MQLKEQSGFPYQFMSPTIIYYHYYHVSVGIQFGNWIFEYTKTKISFFVW